MCVLQTFANGPGDYGSIPGQVIPKTQKMVHDATLSIIRQRSSNPGKGVVPSLHFSVIANEKGAFGLPSTSVTNFTFYLLT